MEQYLARLEEIIKMKQNWTLDKEEGIAAPTEESIIESSRILSIMSKYENQYYIYPSMEGGILIEWSQDNWEASVEVSPDSKSYEFLAVNVQNKDYIDNSKLDLRNNFEIEFQQFLNKF